MARRGGGGGSITEYTIRVAVHLAVLIAVGVVTVAVLASTLGSILNQFPVSTTNPLYNLTKAFQTASSQVANMLTPLMLIGVVVMVIFAIGVVLHVFS